MAIPVVNAQALTIHILQMMETFLHADEENDLLEQVKQLNLREEALAKKSRIEKLKLEVA